MEEVLKIESTDYWFKIVEMLQQNWALIDQMDDKRFEVYFIGDTSGVFGEMMFPTLVEAHTALKRNGFARFADDKAAQEFIAPPEPPFYRSSHPNGPIYSSGKFWR